MYLLSESVYSQTDEYKRSRITTYQKDFGFFANLPSFLIQPHPSLESFLSFKEVTT